VPPDLTDLLETLNLTPQTAVGIPIALVGAVFLSLGAQFQHRGVARVEEIRGQQEGGLSVRSLLALLRRPSWVIGTGLLGLAILFQLTSLSFSPLIVVQPLGALALVITAILNARLSKHALDRNSIRAILMCVGGVALFVTIAALVARSSPITEVQLTVVLVILAIVLAVLGVAFALVRKRVGQMFYVIAAGVLFGFVVTLAKVVIDRIKTLIFTPVGGGGVEWLLIVCIVALVAAALLGTYFVQTAYAEGPPDLVVAGLTVVDPLVAILIGVIVLGEAANAPLWSLAVFLGAGALAILGVISLARHHPQSRV
jgi:drug/metabolite transporter (DMT)-like permease